MMCHARRAAGVLLVMLSCLAGPGCAPKISRQPSLADQMTPDVSVRELDARLIEYAHRYIGRVEHMVGDILRETDDRELRRTALTWAMRTNEEVVRASFYRDPIASMIDLWAMAAQNAEYVARRATEPDAAHSFVDRAVELTARLEQEMEELAMTYGGEQVRQNGRANLDAWVKEHPMTGELYRPSTGPLIARIAPDVSSDLFDTFGNMNESITDISFRLDIMTHQLPKQIIWHAALLTDYYLGGVDIPALIGKVDAALALTEGLPERFSAEREAVMADIDRQRRETLAEIDRQRIALTADIDTQRKETVREIATLTRESFEVVDAQGIRLDEAIERTTQEIVAVVEIQRDAVFAELESVMSRSVAETEGAMTLVDRIFWRVLQSGGLLFVAMILLLFLSRRLWPRAAV